MKLLFAYLTAFSRTGGIEAFNKAFMKAGEKYDLSAVSAYDSSCDENYQSSEKFKGFGGNKLKFMLATLKASFKKEGLILGHVNLGIIGTLYKWLKPKGKLVLITHGIEVWRELSYFQLKAVQKADLILAVSNYTKEQLIERFSVHPDKIKIFFDTIDPYFKPELKAEKSTELLERYGIDKADKVILTLGRIVADEGYKGYDRIIEALPQIKKAVPEVKYIIAGKYDAQEKQRLDQLIAKHQLNDRVIFSGFVADEELNDHFQLADVFAMPSLNEGFGIVFLEALANGVPVVGGDSGGTVDALDQGRLGKLVDPLDHAAIAKGIIEQLQEQKVSAADHQKAVYAKFGFPQFEKQFEEQLIKCVE